VAELERQRDRPIRLRPFSFGPGCPCGLWIGTADAGYIYHEAGTTPSTPRMSLCASWHTCCSATAAWSQFISLLAPDVDHTLVTLILSRGAYSTTEERDAETLASLILSSAVLVASGRSSA